MNFNIQPTSKNIEEKIQHKIDNKTKPIGALGQLEEVALQIALIQQSTHPVLNNPQILVFSGDHGITEEGVSPFPQEVTRQMVENFLRERAAINVFARQHHIKLQVIDAGVKAQFSNASQQKIVSAKIDNGTQNFMHKPAMTTDQCVEAIQKGAEIVQKCHENGTNVLGFGEMGIGNTSSSALLMHLVTGESLDICVGRGTGLDKQGVSRKKEILLRALDRYKGNGSPLDILSNYGGFELVMMVGAFLKGAEYKMTLLVDGFNVSAALLVAQQMNPHLLDYCIFAHQSDEKGHGAVLKHLGVKPLLKLGMRLGEGTGAAVAYPLLLSAVNFLNEMASFEDARVSRNL